MIGFGLLLVGAIIWFLYFCCRRRTGEGLLVVTDSKPMGAFYLDQESFDNY